MAFANKQQLLDNFAIAVSQTPMTEDALKLIRDQNYVEFVGQLAKDMGSMEADLMHMAIGVAGEAGELIDAVKKYWVYGKPLDVANVIEELGDLEFYMAGIRLLLGIARHDVLLANRAKLAQRYGDSYSDEAAIARADKEQPPLVTIDMSKEVLTGEEIELINATKKITDDQVAAVDDTAGLNLANHEQAK